MKQYMVNLAEADRFRAGNHELTINDLGKPVTLTRDDADPGTVVVQRADGQPMGILPRRGNLCKEIIAGARVGHASWQGIGALDEDGYPTSLRVRVVLVEEGEHFEMPPAASQRTYPVGIVGEASYQDAIRRCSQGEQVEILHERNNPHDRLALAVVSAHGDTIGYIARTNWLRDAIHDEGKGCDATIKDIGSNGSAGLLAVVLDVSLNGRGVGERSFSRPPATSVPTSSVQARTSPEVPAPTCAEPRRGWLARLLRL